LSDRGIDVLLRSVERWPGSHNGDGAGAAMFASGGVINRVPADATAFVHRDQFAVLATEAEWTPQDSPRTVARNVSWIEGLAAGLQPYVSGSAYQNFMDRSQPNWQHALRAEHPAERRAKLRDWLRTGCHLPSSAQTADAWTERSCASRAPVGAAMLSDVVTDRRPSAVAAAHCT
jgi:hypothetical protein